MYPITLHSNDSNSLNAKVAKGAEDAKKNTKQGNSVYLHTLKINSNCLAAEIAHYAEESTRYNPVPTRDIPMPVWGGM